MSSRSGAQNRAPGAFNFPTTTSKKPFPGITPVPPRPVGCVARDDDIPHGIRRSRSGRPGGVPVSPPFVPLVLPARVERQEKRVPFANRSGESAVACAGPGDEDITGCAHGHPLRVMPVSVGDALAPGRDCRRRRASQRSRAARGRHRATEIGTRPHCRRPRCLPAASIATA